MPRIDRTPIPDEVFREVAERIVASERRADPTPPPVPAEALPEEWITAAAEAIEDVMIRRLGRDLGTIHRDEIVAAGLAAVVPLARAEGVADGRTAAAALPDGLRGDGPCADCGTLDNIVWFTESVFWNDVVLRDGADAILCIPCFVKRVDATGYYPTAWRLVPDFHWETKAERAARIAEGTATDAG
jgi:hypothetical protein